MEGFNVAQCWREEMVMAQECETMVAGHIIHVVRKKEGRDEGWGFTYVLIFIQPKAPAHRMAVLSHFN